MKFTLSWLRAHLDTDAPLDRITDTLSAIGLEVEGVASPGAALAEFRIAHIVEAVQHPNADRLRACKVETGSGIVSVVCGAPNARTGMKAVFAPPGSFIPGTGITLKTGEIRGVTSAGMLLSVREMGLGTEHDGIVDLPADAPVGMRYAEWAGLDDPVIEIAITPDRGDALAVRGVARDLAAAGIGTLKPWCAPAIAARFASPVTWAIEMPEVCSHIAGRTVRGLANGPSPRWLADRLTAIGLRPINALVDITNFFTFDLGRPLHVFDVDRITGGQLVLRPGAGEIFRALNGRDYVVTPEDCVIADAAQVQSLAGVMGGAASGSEAGTTSVFIECALFDPVRVSQTGRRHQIISDARQRFERGVDPAFLRPGLDAATAMVIDLCGGEASEIAEAGAEPAWRRSARMRFGRLESFGGLAVPEDEAAASLDRLGFVPEARDAESITVAVPSWRNDVAGRGADGEVGGGAGYNLGNNQLDMAADLPPARRAAVAAGRAEMEPECDLIEEVLRLRGLDAVPPVSLPRTSTVPLPTLTPRQSRAALARRALAARGLAECVTFSFMPEKIAALFGGAPASLRLRNPIAADLDQLRPTAIATLALAAARNVARGFGDCALFEIGPAFVEGGQRQVAAGMLTGRTPRHWAEPARPLEAMDAKAHVLAVLAALGVPLDALTVTADAPGFYHPGRSGLVRQGPKTVLASFGELHPSTRAALDLPSPAIAFEIELDAIAEPKRRRRAAPDLAAFQPLRRDFAFVVPPEVTAETLLKAARGAERTLITGVTLFDRYEMPDGQISLGVEVTLQPRERTPTDAEIEAVSDRIMAAVVKATGGSLR